MRRYIFGLIATVAAMSCGPSGSSDDEKHTEGDGLASSFTAFVIDLIEENTVDDAPAVPGSTFLSLPDPDGDSNNVSAYRQLF